MSAKNVILGEDKHLFPYNNVIILIKKLISHSQ